MLVGPASRAGHADRPSTKALPGSIDAGPCTRTYTTPSRTAAAGTFSAAPAIGGMAMAGHSTPGGQRTTRSGGRQAIPSHVTVRQPPSTHISAPPNGLVTVNFAVSAPAGSTNRATDPDPPK